MSKKCYYVVRISKRNIFLIRNVFQILTFVYLKGSIFSSCLVAINEGSFLREWMREFSSSERFL